MSNEIMVKTFIYFGSVGIKYNQDQVIFFRFVYQQTPRYTFILAEFDMLYN